MHPVTVAREAIRDHRAVQKGAELASFLALLMDVQPKVVVEIGSDAGGTLWAWQQICPRVIGVDLPTAGFHGSYKLNDHGCEIVVGNSHNPETLAHLTDLLDGQPIDMLFIDGDHTFKGVQKDYEMYSWLVRPGGIVAFHDICDHPTDGRCKVKAFWDSLDVDKEAIITDPPVWGGIGVVRMRKAAEVAA